MSRDINFRWMVLCGLVVCVGCTTPPSPDGKQRGEAIASVTKGGAERSGKDGESKPIAPPVKITEIPDPLVPVLDSRIPLGENHSGASFDHSAWDALLKACRTPDGFLDVAPLERNRDRLSAYLRAVARVDFSRLERYEQAALLLNAWNAAVCQHIAQVSGSGTEGGLNDLLSRQGEMLVVVGGHRMSMLELEHHVIRKDYADPRLAFALFRGVQGGPSLPSEAFTGSGLHGQMDAVTTGFVLREWKRHPGKVSEYIRWYRSDFGKDPEALQRTLAAVLNGSEDFAEVDGRVVVWLDYDWTPAVR